ncbi:MULTISPECIES: class II fructose-bisphosphate aldolase [Corynebacterium]|uniref:class II fructose-bisphosphate aldolase n=1 Tax=Corynebacterium TaxID=1716 RepID=UPI0011AB7645|nr:MULTISPECIES: class II fructose-bisphosphate aldolase [Corynebacterium]
MTLKDTFSIVNAAAANHMGVGAFNVIHLETAEALAAAAERAELPVILQISHNCVRYHGNLVPLGLATLAIAKASSAAIAVHLDHCEDVNLAKHAVDLGFSSVMFDGSVLTVEENTKRTRDVVRYAHEHGATVEAELGEIGGKGAHTPGVRTDPTEAVDFVAETGVDGLAVAVGSEHAMSDRTASLDINLIDKLSTALEVPLVLHGSSGVPDDEIVRAIQAGMTKINVSTHLNSFYTHAIGGFLDENPDVVDSRKYTAAGRDALSREAERMLQLFAGTGR